MRGLNVVRNGKRAGKRKWHVQHQQDDDDAVIVTRDFVECLQAEHSLADVCALTPPYFYADFSAYGS